MNKRYLRQGLSLIVVSILIVYSCITDEKKNKRDLLKEGYISASDNFDEKGGLLKLVDETQLIIPKNALSVETNITIIRKDAESLFGESKIDFLKIEPEGIQFLSTAILQIPYRNTDFINESIITCFSNINGTHQKLRIIKDEQAKVFKIPVNYSSWIIIMASEKNYPVIDIPSKYLSESDLLFCLKLFNSQSNAFYAFPSAAALYLGTKKADSLINDCSTIIESSNPKIGFSDFGAFKGNKTNLFLGARRHKQLIDSSQRIEIANYAINQLGACYKPVGWSVLEGCFYSVTLTEKAYEETGLDIVPSQNEDPFLVPFEQFNRTSPVSEIYVEIGDTVVIPCYSVVWDSELESYSKNDRLYSIEVVNFPNGASFLNNTFKWVPNNSFLDREINLNFIFTIQGARKPESKSQSLKIHIIPKREIPVPSEISNYFIQNGWIDPCRQDSKKPETAIRLDLNGDHFDEFLLFAKACPESMGIGSLYIFNGNAPYQYLGEYIGGGISGPAFPQISLSDNTNTTYSNITIGNNFKLIFNEDIGKYESQYSDY
jgi:hypothetical protein